jgi:molybdopterin-binding protein
MTKRLARVAKNLARICQAVSGEPLWTISVSGRILRIMTLSARNRLEGKVVEIQVGGVMAHVVISVGKNLIESVITKRSADEMKLKVGDTVSAVIKSTEVMLEKS